MSLLLAPCFGSQGSRRWRHICQRLDTGILLLAENPSPTLHKIAEIYDRIGFAAVGKYNEFETLRQAGVRYADLYFSAPSPPIDFGDEAPTYSDFAYLSFCLGMTYQVADTDVTTNEIRRIVIAQTLLAYLFGAVILASVVNLVAGLG